MTVGPKNHLRNFVNNWFHSVGGQEIPAVDLRAHVNMVTDAQNLTRDNILKYAGFFHGGINDGLEVSPKLAQRSLRLNWMSVLIWWLILRSLNIAHLGSAHICQCLQWMGISHFQNPRMDRDVKRLLQPYDFMLDIEHMRISINALNQLSSRREIVQSTTILLPTCWISPNTC